MGPAREDVENALLSLPYPLSRANTRTPARALSGAAAASDPGAAADALISRLRLGSAASRTAAPEELACFAPTPSAVAALAPASGTLRRWSWRAGAGDRMLPLMVASRDAAAVGWRRSWQLALVPAGPLDGIAC